MKNNMNTNMNKFCLYYFVVGVVLGQRSAARRGGSRAAGNTIATPPIGSDAEN